MSLESNGLYEFGDFRLDVKEKTLMRQDEQISLTPKVFETLCLFVENPGRLIGKEELMEKLWGDSFVEESNLTFNIRQLRIALGDNVQNPLFIKTVPRHGYRFIAEVRNLAEPVPVPPEIIQNPSPSFTSPSFESPRVFVKSTYFLASLVILLIATLVGGMALIWNGINARSKFPILSKEFKSTALTTTGGVALAVVSPNGKRMAYVSNTAGKQSLWVRNFETSENVLILPPAEVFYMGMAFSPDGETIYFARGVKDTGLVIYQLSAIGGIPKEIVKGSQGWISVSPDNRRISYIRCPYEDEDYCSLYMINTDGTNEQKLLTRPRPIRMADNKFSPDGNSIAVALGQSRSGSQDFGMVEIDVNTRAIKEITPRKFFVIKYMRWLPDKSGLIFSAIEHFQDNAKIYQVSLDSGEVKDLTNDSGDYNHLSFDNGFEKLVTTQITSDFRLWTAPLSDPKSATTISFAQGGFAFTPKGKIVYGLTTERTQIWSMNADGSEQRQLTNSQGGNWQPTLSPDERFIYFVSNRTGSNQVWRMNADGSNQIQISTGEGGTPFFVSPDGQSVYYGTSLHANLAKVTITGQDNFVSSPVLNERVYWAQGDPAGKTIAYFSHKESDRFEIKLMNVADSKIFKTFTLTDDKPVLTKMSWSNDGKYLYYLTHKDSKNTLWQLAVETGQSEKFADLGDEEVSDFAFSSDGKTIGFIRGAWKHDAFLIEGLR